MNLWPFPGPVVFSLETSQAVNPWLLTLDPCLTGSPRNTFDSDEVWHRITFLCNHPKHVSVVSLCWPGWWKSRGGQAEILQILTSLCEPIRDFLVLSELAEEFILYQCFADGLLEFVIAINMLQIQIYTAFFRPAVTAFSAKAVLLSPLTSGQVYCSVLPRQGCTGKSPRPV